MEYKLVERTPEEHKCAIGACPRVYELEIGISPLGGNPKKSIHGRSRKSYLIIGTKVDPKEFGLEKRVGEEEVLLSIPKELIDGMKK